MKKTILCVATLTLLFVFAIYSIVKVAGRPANENSHSSVETLSAETIETSETTYVKLSTAEAKEMMDHEDVIILDVRTEEEYRQGYIEGAMLIPDYDLDKLAGELLPDKDATILLYCRSGNRSKQAAHLLSEMGYSNVYDFGGIIDWPYNIAQG